MLLTWVPVMVICLRVCGPLEIIQRRVGGALLLLLAIRWRCLLVALRGLESIMLSLRCRAAIMCFSVLLSFLHLPLHSLVLRLRRCLRNAVLVLVYVCGCYSLRRRFHMMCLAKVVMLMVMSALLHLDRR